MHRAADVDLKSIHIRNCDNLNRIQCHQQGASGRTLRSFERVLS